MNSDLIKIVLDYANLEIDGTKINNWMLNYIDHIWITGEVNKNYTKLIIKYRGMSLENLRELQSCEIEVEIIDVSTLTNLRELHCAYSAISDVSM